MREQLQARLEELRREYETGQARLRELEAEQAYVQETMLRISGAIRVLQELLEADAPARPGDAAAGNEPDGPKEADA